MKLHLPELVALATAALLSLGCGGDDDPCDDPNVVCECAGELTVTVRLASVPDKIQIEWQGEIVVDECAPVPLGPVLYEKRATEIVINDGGFGYRPPAELDLTLIDQKDCVEPAETLIAVQDHPVPGAPFELCTQAEVTLE